MDTNLETLAYIVYQLLDGEDRTERAYRELLRLGFVDEDYEWIYPEDE